MVLLALSHPAFAQAPGEWAARGQDAFDVGHGAEAVADWQRALDLYRRSGDLSGQLGTLDRLGIAEKLIGQPGAAAAHFDEALEIARRGGNPQAADSLLGKLAEAADLAGDLPRSIAANRDLLRAATAAGDAATGSFAAARLGQALSKSGQPAPSATAFRQAADLFGAVGDPRHQAQALEAAGNELMQTEAYIAAAAAYQQAADLAQRTKDDLREASARRGVGRAQLSLGEYDAAIASLNTAILRARRVSDRGIEGSALLTLGNVQYFQAQDDAALQLYQQALDAARAIPDRALEGEALGNRALVYAHLNRFDLAEADFRQDIDIAHARGAGLVEGEALANLASLFNARSRFRDAIPLFQQSLPLLSKSQRSTAIALRNLGLAQLKTDQMAAAEATLRRAIALQDAVRRQAAGDDAANLSLAGTQDQAYSFLEATLVAQHRPEQALEVSEAGRSRALVDLLAGPTGRGAAAPSPELGQIRDIARSRHVTLVEYAVVPADSAIYAWVVQPDGQVVFRRIGITIQGKLDDAIEHLVHDARLTLGALGPNDVPAAKPGIAGRDDMLRLFYRLLIAPLADTLPPSPDAPVVLIPQGGMFLLPFAAFADPQGHALIETHTLLVVPSIETFALLGRGGTAAPGPALVAGNPALSPVKLDPAKNVLTQLPPLPAAGREAQAVADLLHTQPLLAAAASRAAVIARMPGAGVIHLATHGLTQDVHGTGVPGALALAASGGDDGLLTSSDIARQHLNADLVVLSACNTGLGRLSGDGVIGLSRAFIAAGARSVVVSLWYVPDEATATLMPAFYRALDRTHGKAAALRTAMLQTRATQPDPLAWAGFVLVGDGR